MRSPWRRRSRERFLEGGTITLSSEITDFSRLYELQTLIPSGVTPPPDLFNHRELCLRNENELKVFPDHIFVMPFKESGAISLDIQTSLKRIRPYALINNDSCFGISISELSGLSVSNPSVNELVLSNKNVEIDNHKSKLIIWPGLKNEVIVFVVLLVYFMATWLLIEGALLSFTRYLE